MRRKDDVHMKWIRRDEEIPYMTRRFPCCAVCRDNGIFTTARKMEGGIPVCDRHYVGEEVDLENLNLSIDDI